MSAGPAPAGRPRVSRPHGHAEERVRRAAVAAPARRVSGATRVAGPRAIPAPAPPPFGRWAEGLRALPDARWVDRLLRGRAWIALVAVALMGIVAMQVHLLKLNAGIGRAVETAATLERKNAELRAAVAGLSSRERIQIAAQELGLAMPAAGDVRYVHTRGERDVRGALKTMRAPDPPATPVTAVTGAETATGVTSATAPAAGAVPGTAASGTAATGTAAPATDTAATPAATATATATTPPTVPTEPVAPATDAMVPPQG